MSAKEKITNLFHVLLYNNCDDNNNNRNKQQRKTRLYCHLGASDDKTVLLKKFTCTVKYITFSHIYIFKNIYILIRFLEAGIPLKVEEQNFQSTLVYMHVTVSLFESMHTGTRLYFLHDSLI